MGPIAAFYLAVKRKYTGRIQFVPAEKDQFGVIKVALVEGNIIGLDSTWGVSLKNLEKLLNWRKAIIKEFPILPGDYLPRVYVPRTEALALITELELNRLMPDLRTLTPEDARILLKIRIGKRVSISPEDVARIKSGETYHRTFFLQHPDGYASTFIAGKEVQTFKLDGDEVVPLKVSDLPEDNVCRVSVDHMVGLAISTPLFAPSVEIEGKDILAQIRRLKADTTRIWHLILTEGDESYVSVLGYRGYFIGTLVVRGDEVKVEREDYLLNLLENLKLKGRLYEHGKGMRST
ncbi:MAG: hypothetical protein GXO29_02020 [Thermotogae bacterium]|nr:hypothetical protein [Thermotogota bacterium]